MFERVTLASPDQATTSPETDAERRWPVPHAAMLVTTTSAILWSLLAGLGVWLTG
jgi:hypothetical protein